MNIGEFFIKLGIKGALGVKNALTGIQDGLAKTSDISGATKASLFGMVVALEEFTRRSVVGAMEMTKFHNATDISTDSLQKWQYVARMNNVAAEEMTNTLSNIQLAAGKLKLGVAVPGGSLLAGIDYTKDPVKVWEDIIKKVRSLPPELVDVNRAMAEQLGISRDMFALARKGNLTGPPPGLIRSQQELAQLNKVGIDWLKFWETVNATLDKKIAMNAEGLGNFVKVLTNAVSEAGTLFDRLDKAFSLLATHTDGFASKMDLIAASVIGVTAVISPMSAAVLVLVAALNDLHKFESGQKSITGDLFDPPTGAENSKKFNNFISGLAPWLYDKMHPDTTTQAVTQKLWEPDVANRAFGSQSSQGDVKVNSVVNFYGPVGDANDHARAVAREIQNQLSQSPARSQ